MLIRADARRIPLVDGCVQCVVTSPPYWGLRDYGNTCQLGLEPMPDAYVQSMLAVFAELWRVLKDDGTCWLNLGASYLGGTPGSGGPSAKQDSNRGSRFSLGDKRPIQSLRGQRVRAYGTDGRGLPDSTVSGSAYSGLCDGCLSDFQTHRASIAGTGQQTARSWRQPELTARDSEPLGCDSASPDVSLPVALESNTLESWLLHRGECSRCDSRASYLSTLHSSSGDAQAFSRMTWLDYTRRLKHKDMVPVPWLVAMALQADGWYLRSDIIWSKPNPMPESVTDRPTKAHEYIFLLSKSERYHYDADAIREAHTEQRDWPTWEQRKAGGAAIRRGDPGQFGDVCHWAGVGAHPNGRNKRSVWNIATQPYSGSHFATFPEALIEPCILAGSRPGDLVYDPFIGSGTVGAVCDRLMRRWVGTDLSYQHLAKQRTAQRGLRLA